MQRDGTISGSTVRLHDRREFMRATGSGLLAPWLSEPSIMPSKGIRIGCCAPLDQLQLASSLGFDYLEPAAAAVAALTPEQFQKVRGKVLESAIRCEAFNSFIGRSELAVVGPKVDLPAVKEYVDSTLERCRQLGASIVVWGSAGSRNVPDGFPRTRAWDQIATFLNAIAPLAARREIVISLEPLNRRESNILNTGRETLKMVKQVNLPHIAMIIDYYHLRLENEDLGIFEEARGKVNHIHFARPQGRLWPKSAEEDVLYASFFRTLRAINWSGGMSIEGNGLLATDGAESLAFFRKELGNRYK